MTPEKPLGKGATVVYERLRKEILEGKIVPGALLQQNEIAEKFGVSRTPARDALHQLASDGLVEFLRGQTARVVSASLEDEIEIRQIRLWLEVPALLQALRNNPQPDELLGILDQIEALGDEPTPKTCERIVVLDEQFHRWLLRECGNKRLESVVGRLLDILFRGTPFNVVQGYRGTRDNLLAIREAVQSGDIRRVRQLMIQHMLDTSAFKIEAIGFEDI